MAEPLRIVGTIGNKPRLDLRPVSDLSPKEFMDLIAQRFGIAPGSGERHLEIRYENGSFAWAKIHTGRLGLDHFGT